jgi:hypothetical protein
MTGRVCSFWKTRSKFHANHVFAKRLVPDNALTGILAELDFRDTPNFET